MRKFSLEDYEQVKVYEKDFTRAINSRYCSGLMKDQLDIIQKIYNETLNRQANLSCGGCVLQMMTSVGRLYFAFKEKYMAQLEEEKKAQKEQTIKKKRVRRKKNEKETEEKSS